MTWCDDRDGRGIYAQRISSVGTLLWAENGVPIYIGIETMYSHKALPDGAGGAIIVWWDSRSGNSDIYAQRIDSDGDILWAADGIPVCSATGDQELPYIITDGSGGAIIAWLDGRAGNSDIYAQRIDPSGAILWTADGVPVASGSGDQESHQVVEDGGGGAIIVWIHDPEGTSDIMAQKMSSGGTLEWLSAGVPVCTIGVDITKIVMTGDGAGNAIVAWDDLRTPGVYGEIYAALISDALTDAIVPGPGTAARLHQNYPNPFNPATTIEYYLSESGPVTIEIYDVAGRLVTRLLDGEHREQGPHGEIWDGRDENGRDMVSGVYIYRLESGKITLSRKMLLLK